MKYRTVTSIHIHSEHTVFAKQKNLSAGQRGSRIQVRQIFSVGDWIEHMHTRSGYRFLL